MADGIKRGSVIIPDHPPIIVSWRHHAHWLHCIAVHGPQTDRIDSAVMALADCPTDTVFSARERDSFSRAPSAAVRALARQLLAQHGISDRSEEHTSELQSLMRI